VLLAALAACAAEVPPPPPVVAPIPAPAPTPPPPPPREAPPVSGPSRPFRLPAATWNELPSGLKVAALPIKGQPLAQIRVVVGAGSAADGERPGLAGLTAEILDAGARLAPLGADLSIDAGFDATTFSLAVGRAQLGEALDLLAAALQRPELGAPSLDRLRKREERRLSLAAREDAAWGARVMLFRDLFSLPTEHHPYATSSPTPGDLRRITIADCRAFHRRFYVPRNVMIVVAGDAAIDDVGKLAAKAFAGFSGGEPPVVPFTDPETPAARKLTLVDRPGAPSADVFVGALGPARAGRSFAAFAVASEILGGPAGRLADDLVAKQGLAEAAGASVTEFAHAPSVIIAHAHARAPSTGAALQALLGHLASLSEKVPEADEVEAATRSLGGTLAVRLQTSGALAGELARLRTLGLPDDHHEALRKELGEITPALALKAAGEAFRAGHEIIVVSGDAAILGPVLARFGEVKVVDPARDFARIRTIPAEKLAPAHQASTR
jgi:predicted Zn-dependent peptidase